jgi:hypothetical protein
VHPGTAATAHDFGSDRLQALFVHYFRIADGTPIAGVTAMVGSGVSSSGRFDREHVQ